MNPGIKSNPAPLEKALRLLQHWAMSTETAFRIPELLTGLQIQRTAEFYPFQRLRIWSPTSLEQTMPLSFVRRVFRREQDEAPVRHQYQFTCSRNFEEFRNGISRALLSKESWDEQKLFAPLDKCCAGARNFLRDLEEKQDRGRWWQLLLNNFVLAIGDRELVLRLRQLTSELFNRGTFLGDDREAQRFSALNDLYSLYSRLSHTGYVSSVLDRYHFSSSRDGSCAGGQPNTLAYLIKVVPAAQFRVLGLFRICADRTIECLAKNGDPYYLDQHQPPPRFVPEIPDEENQAHFDELFTGGATLWGNRGAKPCLFSIFNHLRSSDKAGRHSTDKDIFQLALPVYQQTFFESLSGRRWKQKTSGAFLGWLYLDFPEPPTDIIVTSPFVSDDFVDPALLRGEARKSATVPQELFDELSKALKGIGGARDFRELACRFNLLIHKKRFGEHVDIRNIRAPSEDWGLLEHSIAAGDFSTANRLLFEFAFAGQIKARRPFDRSLFGQTSESALEFRTWVEQEMEGCISQQAYVDLVRIHNLLNSFSQLYLAGEMEWAFSEPWPEDTLTPEEFVKHQYFHCDGWQGTDVPHGENCGNHYFRFIDCGRRPVFPANEKEKPLISPKEKLLLVNLSPQGPLGPLKEGPVLAFRRQTSTALPNGDDALFEYGTRVATRVRLFYARTVLRWNEVQAAGRAAQIQSFKKLSHETKHIAQALVDEQWFVQLAPQQLQEATAEMTALDGHVHVAPIPEIIHSAGSAIYLWCPQPNPIILERYIDFTSLQSMVSSCWTAAKDNFKAKLGISRNLSVAASLQELRELLRKMDEIWKYEKWITAHASRNQWLALAEATTAQRIGLTRLFLALLREIIQHGHPDAPTISSFRLDQVLAIQVCCTPDARDNNSLAGGPYAALNVIRQQGGEREGERIIDDLCHELGAIPRRVTHEGKYCLSIDLQWPPNIPKEALLQRF